MVLGGCKTVKIRSVLWKVFFYVLYLSHPLCYNITTNHSEDNIYELFRTSKKAVDRI